MNKKWIRICIIAGFAIFFGYATLTEADEYSSYISLGSTVANSSSKIGGSGVRFYKYDFGVQIQEPTEFKHGVAKDQIKFYHLTRLVKVKKFPRVKLQAGISRVDGSPDIGEWNFRLGIGYVISVNGELWYIHDSSAGIFDPNAGSDQITYIQRLSWL